MILVLYDNKMNVKMMKKQVIGLEIMAGCPVFCWTDRYGEIHIRQLRQGEMLALREEEK